MPFATAVEHISLVKKVIDQDWLSKELERISSYAPPEDRTKLSFIDYSQQFHPLAFLIHQVDRQLQSSGDENVTEEILRLSHIGDSLSVLLDKNTERLSDKIRDLTSAPELFEKTIYEMQVASAYARADHKVAFLEERPVEEIQTPDLLIDGRLEAECKRKDRLTDRDKKNNEHWKLMMRRASSMMGYLRCNYAIIVKAQRDPVSEDVEFTLRELEHLMKNLQQGRFPFPEKGIGISLRTLSKIDVPINCNSIEFGSSEDLDFFTIAMEKKAGDLLIRNPRIFGFKSALMPDRIKSVIESIKKARKQLSGDRPGLIYVDLNTMDSQMMELDFRRLDTMIKDQLRNNSTISGVVITSEVFRRDRQGLVYTHKAKVIRNHEAKHPVPLKIVGEP